MSIPKPNDPCPCGSGKKYEDCCLGKIAPGPASPPDNVVPNLTEIYGRASSLHQAGRLAEAAAAYRDVLAHQPGHVESLQMLSAIEYQSGRREGALHWIDELLKVTPRNALAYFNRGILLQELKRFDEALDSYDRALALKPDYAEAYNNRGNVLTAQGKLDAAIDSYDRALALSPNSAQAYNNRGNALKEQGVLDAALDSYDRTIALNPNFAEAYSNRGVVFYEKGELDAAIDSYERAIALNPNYAEAYNNRGNAFKEQDKLGAAIDSYERAIALNPDYAAAYNNRGVVLTTQGKFEAAAESYQKAILLRPDDVEARWGFAMAQIPLVADSGENLALHRQEFKRQLAELDTWFDNHPNAAGDKAVGTSQPFHLAYQEENNRDLLAQYGNLCAKLMREWQERQQFHPSVSVPNVRVRIGIISAHIRDHPVWNAIVKGWLEHFDRAQFEFHIFHLGFSRDDETSWAESQTSSFEQGGRGLKQWVENILEKRLDVLIYPEIGMDQVTVKLASLRLAPVQIASWGHPETTGLPTIDYYLSADDFEPSNAQEHYTERLIRLPHLGCCYHPQKVAGAEPDFENLGITSGVPLLILPGTPFKYAPQHDRVLVEIARKLGRCQFVFFTYFASPALSEKLQRRLEYVFTKAEMDFHDFCIFMPWQKRPTFFGLLKRADVFLDTIGFSGFNTAMQAVECGLPIVTLEGRFMRGRLASGILKRLGLQELVVNTEQEYVDLAVKLALDASYREAIKSRIEISRSLAFDDVAPIQALEEFLVKVVKEA